MTIVEGEDKQCECAHAVSEGHDWLETLCLGRVPAQQQSFVER